jgi:hypothetical protein
MNANNLMLLVMRGLSPAGVRDLFETPKEPETGMGRRQEVLASLRDNLMNFFMGG